MKFFHISVFLLAFNPLSEAFSQKPEPSSKVKKTFTKIALRRSYSRLKKIIDKNPSACFKSFINQQKFLHGAALKLDVPFMDFLIEQGADVKAIDKYGYNIFHWISVVRERKIEEIIFKFNNLGININQQSGEGETPLHLAVFRGQENAVAAFLKMGADPNIKDKRGDTALHNAARLIWGGPVVKALIENGADIKIRNNKNETPGELYIKNNKRIKVSTMDERMRMSFKLLNPDLKLPIDRL